MARIPVSVDEIELEGDEGGIVPSVAVTCEHCGETVEVYGTSDASIKRGCVMLREQCGSNNFYSYESDDE